MTAAILKLPSKPWPHACDEFQGSNRFCRRCQFTLLLHKTVYCSSCGRSFYRDSREGYSHCSDHAPKRGK